MKWGIVPGILIAVAACAPPQQPSASAEPWCLNHRAEVLIADEIEDPDELVRLIGGAATARMARRIQAESQFLFEHGADAMPPLEMIRELESYTDGSESDFSGFSEDVWLEVEADQARFEAACSRAAHAHDQLAGRVN